MNLSIAHQQPDKSGNAVYTARTIAGIIVPHFVSHQSNARKENDEVEQNAVSVYPNPTDGKLIVKHPKESILINITDLSGRILMSINSNYKMMDEIDLSELASGVYLCEIKSDAKTLLIQKVVLVK